MTLEIVPFAGAHFSSLTSWFSDLEEVVMWGGTSLSFPLDEGQLAGMLAQSVGNRPQRQCFSALVDGELVGHAQLAFDWQNGVSRLGRVAVAPHCRGRGYARPMLNLIIAAGFAYRQIERIELNVFSQNNSAFALYERLGFSLEGNRRSSALVDGHRWDTKIMAILREEFVAAKQR